MVTFEWRNAKSLAPYFNLKIVNTFCFSLTLLIVPSKELLSAGTHGWYKHALLHFHNLSKLVQSDFPFNGIWSIFDAIKPSINTSLKTLINF